MGEDEVGRGQARYLLPSRIKKMNDFKKLIFYPDYSRVTSRNPALERKL
jgi:hypothetical protein